MKDSLSVIVFTGKSLFLIAENNQNSFQLLFKLT